MYVFWPQSLDSNLRHLLDGLKFEPVTEPGLKLSLFAKCIESESTDSAKYFQNLRQSLNFESDSRLKSVHETAPRQIRHIKKEAIHFTADKHMLETDIRMYLVMKAYDKNTHKLPKLARSNKLFR